MHDLARSADLVELEINREAADIELDEAKRAYQENVVSPTGRLGSTWRGEKGQDGATIGFGGGTDYARAWSFGGRFRERFIKGRDLFLGWSRAGARRTGEAAEKIADRFEEGRL